MRGYGAPGGRYHVGVHRGIVEAKPRSFFVREFADVATVGIAVAHAERQVRVAIWPAHVLIKKRLCHEFSDARVPFVCEGILAYFVGARRRYHFFEKLLVGFRGAFHNTTSFEPQLNARYLVAVAIERLIETYPAFRTAPIGRSEYLKARDV